ncbi:MAG: Lrp/AsnC family transcriptional regulator, partial [Nanoarchaeota archaeon]
HMRKSPQLLKYGIAALEKEGILRDPFYIFDYSYLGLILFRVYFKSAYVKERDKLKIVQELRMNPYVLSIYELTGEFDLGVEFASPNPSRFNKEFKKIISDNPLLKEYKIILNLVTHIYPRHYLLKTPDLLGLNAQKIVGGDREKEELSREEIKILHIILNKPTIRYTGLAKESGMNVKTAKLILNNLIKRNIVKGCKYLIDKNKLGIAKSRLFLKLHNLSLERESSLMKYLLETKDVVQVNKTVGDWDMEIDLEALDNSRIRSMFMKLREEYSDIIAQFNLIEFYDYYKRTYLPEYIFIDVNK